MVPPIPSQLALRLLLLLLISTSAYGGGPAFVAGKAFDPAVSGKPLVWASGTVSYYTDQGDLSTILPQSSANAFVADAFTRWTNVTTAALIASRAGALAEDVSGSNVISTISGISLPSDIQTSSTKPLAIVYDLDGRVIETLLGAGAGDPSLCATNSVIGGVDRFSTDGHIVHALLIINGRCASSAADLAPLKYHLIRAIGRALGLGWSQANDNVQTGSPAAGSADYLGFPLMHPIEPFCVGAITSCLPSADQPRTDDRAAISRLYPVTAQNLGAFPGKQLFSLTTARIHGSIYFPDAHGNPGQPMQGVNVVARLIDPNTGLASRSAVVASVSGFLFRGNAGNPVSGYGAPQRYDTFGGFDTALEGFFDLAGLEIPAGQTTASFQLTMEAINPVYHDDFAVSPYASGLVTPSGVRQTIVVADLAAGTDVTRDIVMTGAAVSRPSDRQTVVQKIVSPGGDWWGTLAGYGRTEFYSLHGQPNRSVALQVTSMNESLRPTTNKLRPELGLWNGSDPLASLPQASADSFNDFTNGATTLIAPISSAGTIQLGIADYRGDGRPDFIYHAHILYADSVSPQGISGAASNLFIKGIGFRQGVSVTIGGANATVLSVDASSLLIQSPALSGGAKTITVHDAVSGLSVDMTNALTVGTSGSDHILSIGLANPNVAVGIVAPNDVRYQVVHGDGTTASGIPVTVAVSPSTSRINACGLSSCTLNTDANGEVSSFVTVNAAGANVITAALSNGQHQDSTITGIATLTLSAVVPQTTLLTGTSTTVPLAVRVMSSGAGVAGKTVDYSFVNGLATLSSASAITDAAGNASVNLTINNLSAAIALDACSAGLGCVRVSVSPVAPTALALKIVGGDGQSVLVGQALQPLVLRVVDSSLPPKSLAGIPVTISGTAFKTLQPNCAPDTGVCRPQSQHAVANFGVTLVSDVNGLVTYTPAAQAAWGPVQIGVMASAGANASQTFSLQVFAPTP